VGKEWIFSDSTLYAWKGMTMEARRQVLKKHNVVDVSRTYLGKMTKKVGARHMTPPYKFHFKKTTE
jgi:hypothetical protein